MSSDQTRFPESDNNLETVVLTGYITNNGSIDSSNNDPPQHPAYAEINLAKSQNFMIDTRDLILRSDAEGTGIHYLLRIYIESTTLPENFEWTMFIELPQRNQQWICIEIFRNKDDAENVHNNCIFELSNQPPDGNDVWPGMATIKMQVVNNNYIIKSVSPELDYC
jgi:hypothetical protein